MELHEFEQEFNKAWNTADYKQKKVILREIDKIVNRKQSENNRIKAFFQAVENEKVVAARNLLDQGVNVNEKDDVLGNTALSKAVIDRNVEMVKVLLEHGADPHIDNNRGYNAIHAAELIGNAEIIELIN